MTPQLRMFLSCIGRPRGRSVQMLHDAFVSWFPRHPHDVIESLDTFQRLLCATEDMRPDYWDKRSDGYYPMFRSQIATDFCASLGLPEPAQHSAPMESPLAPMDADAWFAQCVRFVRVMKHARNVVESTTSRSAFVGRYGMPQPSFAHVLDTADCLPPQDFDAEILVTVHDIANVVTMLSLPPRPYAQRLRWALAMCDALMHAHLKQSVA